jgi:hypothetical protein
MKKSRAETKRINREQLATLRAKQAVEEESRMFTAVAGATQGFPTIMVQILDKNATDYFGEGITLNPRRD